MTTKRAFGFDEDGKPAATARVRYSSGRTINLGNYESARVDVSVDMECANNKRAIEQAFQNAKQFVDQKVDEEEATYR